MALFHQVCNYVLSVMLNTLMEYLYTYTFIGFFLTLGNIHSYLTFYHMVKKQGSLLKECHMALWSSFCGIDVNMLIYCSEGGVYLVFV